MIPDPTSSRPTQSSKARTRPDILYVCVCTTGNVEPGNSCGTRSRDAGVGLDADSSAAETFATMRAVSAFFMFMLLIN